MTATLKTINELLTGLAGAADFSLTEEDISNVVQSLAKVAGTLSVFDGDVAQARSGGWNRLDCFVRSIDTQGVQEGLIRDDVGSYFHVWGAGAGDYTCGLKLRFIGDTAGDYEFRIARATDVDGTMTSTGTPFRDKVTLAAGEEADISIVGALIKNIEGGDRLQVEFRAPSNSNITVSHGQFSVQR